MQTEAYAKINLTLDITGRDERGYHLLSSVFATVSLSDTVTLEPAGADIVIECDQPSVPTDERNLCHKAALALWNACDLPAEGLRIGLEKRIPSGAGLGGGSSDAAAVIRLLCERYGLSTEDYRVRNAALRVGADVPFFLRGGVCLAEGVGEFLTPLPSLSGYSVVLAKTEEFASTPRVYGIYDEDALSYPPTTPAFLSALREGRAIAPHVSNHLTRAASSLCPSVPILRDRMRSLGACAAEMSGSGSAVYGLFLEGSVARNAVKNIDAQFCEICRFV